MKDPVGFAWNTKYTAYLFDVIPLRPINVGVIVTTTNGGWEAVLLGIPTNDCNHSRVFLDPLLRGFLY